MPHGRLNYAVAGTALLWLGVYGCGGDDTSGGNTAGKGGAAGSANHSGAGKGGVTAGQGGKQSTAGTGTGGANNKGGTGGSHAGSSGTGGSQSSAGEGGAGAPTSAGGTSPAAGTGEGGTGNNAAGAGAGGESAGGKAGAGGEGGAGHEPQSVTALGCFATTGDGWDFFESGAPAVLATIDTGDYCGGKLIADNPGLLTPEFPPSTLRFTREFRLDPSLGVGASLDLVLSYRADDAAEFILNGKSIAACTPPSDNDQACISPCVTTSISPGDVRTDGSVNRLEIILTNLVVTDAGNGNFGYTDLAYSLCASAI